jgi:hypothetical protein
MQIFVLNQLSDDIDQRSGMESVFMRFILRIWIPSRHAKHPFTVRGQFYTSCSVASATYAGNHAVSVNYLMLIMFVIAL